MHSESWLTSMYLLAQRDRFPAWRSLFGNLATRLWRGHDLAMVGSEDPTMAKVMAVLFYAHVVFDGLHATNVSCYVNGLVYGCLRGDKTAQLNDSLEGFHVNFRHF